MILALRRFSPRCDEYLVTHLVLRRSFTQTALVGNPIVGSCARYE